MMAHPRRFSPWRCLLGSSTRSPAAEGCSPSRPWRSAGLRPADRARDQQAAVELRIGVGDAGVRPRRSPRSSGRLARRRVVGPRLVPGRPHSHPHPARFAAPSACPSCCWGSRCYFALSPRIADDDVHHRMPRRLFLLTVVPLIGFYDGVFGPGTGSFFMIGFRRSARPRPRQGDGTDQDREFRQQSRWRWRRWPSRATSYGPSGLAMGIGQFFGARLGAGLTMRHGAGW